MDKVNCVIVLLFVFLKGNAQTYTIHYKRTANIEYQLRNEKDPAIRQRVSSYLRSNAVNYELVHSEKKSLYYPIKKSEDDNTYLKMNTTSLNSYYKNMIDSTYLTNSSIQGQLFVIRDSLKNYTWDFHEDYKVIIGYNCQKATTSIYNQSFIAYFTKEIPTGNGPSLFGIENATILELDVNAFQVKAFAIYEKKEVQKIEAAFDGVVITQEEYDQKINNFKLEHQMLQLQKN